MKTIRQFDILKINNFAAKAECDNVIVEYTLAISINGNRFVNLLCTPKNLKELVIGYMLSEGIIRSLSDIESINIDEDEGYAKVKLLNKDMFTPTNGIIEAVRTVTTACGKQHSIAYQIYNDIGMEKIIDGVVFSVEDIMPHIALFNRKSELFDLTGGVHSCALCNAKKTLFFMEDIGRHNAFDKVLGCALLGNTCFDTTFLITSGRIPSDMVIKAINAKIPLIISRSAPTDRAIELAEKYNITLVGFARGTRMNVYSSVERLSIGGKKL